MKGQMSVNSCSPELVEIVMFVYASASMGNGVEKPLSRERVKRQEAILVGHLHVVGIYQLRWEE